MRPTLRYGSARTLFAAFAVGAFALCGTSVIAAGGGLDRSSISAARDSNLLSSTRGTDSKLELASNHGTHAPRVGGPLVFDGGPPTGPNAYGFRGYSLADDFELTSSVTLESYRVSYLQNTTWDGAGTYRIFADAGGAVGALVASGTLTDPTIQATGDTMFGFPVLQTDGDFENPVTLGPGTYWFSIEADPLNCDPGGIYWIESNPGFGLSSVETAGCGLIPTTPSGWSYSFQLFGACTPDVLIVSSDCDSGETPALEGILEASGAFGAVDTFNNTSAVPTLSFLQNYDSVLVYRCATTSNGAATGNVMADYHDAGGGVVVTIFANTGCCDSQLGGRWQSGGYAAIVPGGIGDSGSATLGTVFVPAHPIMQGISDISISRFAPNPGLLPNAVRIAELNNGRPLVATQSVSGHDVVDLGLAPAPFAGFDTAGHEDELIINSLLYAANCAGGPVDPCLEDTDDPIILDCPGDFSTPCNTPGGYNLDYTPMVIDDCDTTFVVEPAGTLPYGTTLVTVTVTDQSGNEAECSFSVTVTPDVQEPLRTQSIGTEDGYVREPNLITMAEGPAVPKGTVAQVGDDSGNWQNRGVFSFDTSGLPDDAVVTTVTLRLTRASLAGNVAPLGNLLLDMGGSVIGANAGLDTFDYDDASATALNVATSFPVPAGNGFTTFASVDSAYNGLVDVAGRTQFRVRFETLTDGDNQSDYISFHTGEAASIVRPELIVEYYTPSCFEYPVLDAPCDGPFEVTLWSTAAEDGGVGESHYTSEVGGSFSAASGTSAVGDTGSRTQQKMYLNFDTSAIPAGATITSAELRMYRSSATGTAAASLGALVVDMRNPYLSGTSFQFGSSAALEAADFQAFAHFPAVATLTVPASNTYTATFLNPTGLLAINKGGATQMRLRFTLPDDGDFLADQVNFGTGNFGATSPGRPRLVVTYMTPCP